VHPVQSQYQSAFTAQSSFQPFNFTPSLQHQPQDYSSEARWKGKWRQGVETQEDVAAFDRAFAAHAEEITNGQSKTWTVEGGWNKASTLDEKTLLSMRHKLQRAFVSRNDSLDVIVDVKDVETMDNLLSALESSVGNVTGPMIRQTKMDKLLGIMASKNIPLEEQYHFQARAGELLSKYRNIMAEETRIDPELHDLPQPQEVEMAAEEPAGTQEQQLEQEEAQPQEPPIQADEDLARTAGELLANLADNETPKFRESSFLSLMRKLRDREVHVRGDKMVDIDVSFSISPFASLMNGFPGGCAAAAHGAPSPATRGADYLPGVRLRSCVGGGLWCLTCRRRANEITNRATENQIHQTQQRWRHSMVVATGTTSIVPARNLKWQVLCSSVFECLQR